MDTAATPDQVCVAETLRGAQTAPDAANEQIQLKKKMKPTLGVEQENGRVDVTHSTDALNGHFTAGWKFGFISWCDTTHL